MKLNPTSYLKLDGNTWHFTKHRKNQKRVVMSLQTSDLREAQRKRDIILGKIAEDTERTYEHEALEQARFHFMADDDGKEGSEYGTDHWVEGLLERGEVPEDQAVRLYKIATNQLTPVMSFYDAWNRERPVGEGAEVVRRSALKQCPFKYVHEANPKTVGRYISDLVENSGLAVTTMNQRLIQYRSYWNFLQSKGVTKENPWQNQTIRQQRQAKKQVGSQLWNFDEVRRMAREVADNEYNFGLCLALYSGCRISEIAKMRVRDVHNDHWVVVESKTQAGEGRPIFLPPYILNGLIFRCSDRKPSDYVMWRDVRVNDGDFKRTASIDAKASKILADLFPEHKVEGRRNRVKTLHGLRKVAASTCEALDIPPHVWHGMLGWSRGSTGLDVYSKPDPKIAKDAFAKLHAKFDEELKGV